MIVPVRAGHHSYVMTSGALSTSSTWRVGAPGLVDGRSDPARLRVLVDDHFEFIWRSVRRLGVPAADADDAAQQVFMVASRRLGEIEPGKERSFLFGTALRVAAEHRRSIARRREAPSVEREDPGDPGPGPDELTDRRRARELLDAILSALDLELRTVFVLFEIEELAAHDIAKLLGVPAGTVASRLRRAREEFQSAVKRWRARESFCGRSR